MVFIDRILFKEKTKFERLTILRIEGFIFKNIKYY